MISFDKKKKDVLLFLPKCPSFLEKKDMEGQKGQRRTKKDSGNPAWNLNIYVHGSTCGYDHAYLQPCELMEVYMQ